MDRFRLTAIALASMVGAGLAYLAYERAPSTRLDAARELVFERRVAEAAAAYEALTLSLDPESHRDAWVEAHVRLAELRHLEQDDPRGAAELYRRLLATAPDAEASWAAREHLAEIARHELDDRTTALEQWHALALSGRPNADRFAYRAARTHFTAGEYERAREVARALVERSPAGRWTDDALLLVASSHELEHAYDDAVVALEEAETRFPGTDVAARARYRIGQVKAAQRDWEGAQAALLQALETHPDPWRVQADLARVQRHLAEARKIRPITRTEALAR